MIAFSGTSRTRDVNNAHILILGEDPTTSAPSATLFRALRRAGENVRFSNRTERDGLLSWRHTLKDVCSVVLVAYERIGSYLLGQLAYAVSGGIPVVRWWVGTDVMNLLADHVTAESARILDGIVSANIAVSPHLVSELRAAGIKACFVPSVIDSDPSAVGIHGRSPTLRPILVYLPARRQEFYGRNIVEAAIVKNSALQFIVVGDDSHSLASHANVQSLGWVADMSEIYDMCGCILRVTRHDGMPRMLIEGLLRGMYAIYAWPFAGCWLAKTVEEVQSGLAMYATTTEPNYHGRAAILEMIRERPGRRFVEIATARAPGFNVRIAAMQMCALQKFAAKLNGTLGHA